MSKAKSGAKQVDVPVVEKPKVDEVEDKLLAVYNAYRRDKQLDIREFAHAKYSNWMRFFGFSMEREHMWLNAEGKEKKIAVSKPTSGPSTSKESIDLLANANLVPEAGVGLAEQSKYSQIDEHALTVEIPMGGTLDCIASTLCAPYAIPTWRQTAADCDNFKVRAIFRWMCDQFRLVMPTVTTQAPTTTVTLAVPEVAGTKSSGKNPAGKEKAGKTEAPKVQDSKSEMDSKEIAAHVIQAKAADPQGLATLFYELCTAVAVRCEVVHGTLKGVLDNLGKPVGFLPWAWNIVHVSVKQGEEPLQFLIDVSLGLAHVGPRAGGMPPSQTPHGKAPTESFGGTQPVAGTGYHCPAFVNTAELEKHFEPFYFYTDPRHFASLHFPNDTTKLLLARTVSRTAWEVAPRLDHHFFKLGLKLESHCRRSIFTVKSTPFFLSIILTDTQHVDVCLAMFKGPVTALNFETSVPLDRRFLWAQRQEREGRVTFSIMAPDVGTYTLVVGARSLRGERGQFLYHPVVSYQANISFVPVNEPMYPLQACTPALCKIHKPLGHKVTVGSQHFSVVPVSPSVRCVAVVNKVQKTVQQPVKGDLALRLSPRTAAVVDAKKDKLAKESGKKVELNVSQNAADGADQGFERIDVTMLELNYEKALFEGDVLLDIGEVEVWAYIDPGDAASKPYALQISPTKAQSLAEEGAPAFPAASDTAQGSKSNQPIAFRLVVKGIASVKRIPPKELGLNDGEPLIQPQLDVVADRIYIYRLMSETTDDGRSWTAEAASLIGKPLVPVGGYFREHPDALED